MVSSKVVDFFPSERDQGGLQGVFCPTVGANVLVCLPGPLQQQVFGKASKRADFDAQSLEPTGGGPARPLRRSSQQNVLKKIKYKRKKIAYHD
ncbi:hypothetical protein PIB30_035947 [Stylosanthes scabra]|uniref:Uncharacterized protein n=1 Tax=Stylosanthes scabra TaxID=79078 RepID=A0ABU6QCV8_9FABA|nr:hypothetical protein [Stylosanthes scabra]